MDAEKASGAPTSLKLPRLGVVRLAVTSLEKALPIWCDIVGLQTIDRDDTRASLGVGEVVLVELNAIASAAVPTGSTGLYHVALHVPHLRDLAMVVARATQRGIPHSTADYLITQACYLSDHDGNGIEIAFESPWRGRLNFDMSTYSEAPAFDVDGNGWPWRKSIDPATLQDALANGSEYREQLSHGTCVGHVHLGVRDLQLAVDFYAAIPGFDQQYFLPQMGFADFRTDYPYHILALNSWNGPTALRQSDGSAGLMDFAVIVSSASQLEAIASRLSSGGYSWKHHEESIETADPSGNRLRIILRH